jgi:hypothetical protein
MREAQVHQRNIPVTMVSTQDDLKHVLKLMVIEEDTVEFLIDKHISRVWKLAHASKGAYKALVNEDKSKLFPPDVNQITMSKRWFHDKISEKGQMTNENIIQEFKYLSWLAHSVAYTYTSGKLDALQLNGGD